MKKINQIIQWWLTPYFPLVHLEDKTNFVKKWLFHPIKRRMARGYLKFLQKFTKIKVIAITGSAGKTTTKEMLSSILKNYQSTIYAKDNIDPIYNIPSTILKTPPGTKFLILEMGVEYPNEMDFYLWLAKPDIGVITNIFPTHLEFLGGISGVLKEKSKLVLSLQGGDIAVLNSGDKNLKSLNHKIKVRIQWFGSSEDQLKENASAAATVARCLKVPENKISEGLNKYQKPVHRLSLVELKDGAVILDDSYNSNPEALSKALQFFEQKAGKNNKIAVLGDMKELGKYEESFHREMGRKISKLNFEAVIGVGSAMKYLVEEINKGRSDTKTYLVEKREDVFPLLRPYLQNGNYILIKGSRSVALDKLVDALV
jgi:UDP-N-acetylmuramoyl-tripeptide--D-alanyl-D-alanine ligase